MRRKPRCYRIGIYWTEVGTVNEGGMEDEQSVEVDVRPTPRLMGLLQTLVQAMLTATKWILR
jgi:hypothetical protein